MRRNTLSIVALIALAGCGRDWRDQAIADGEALVRQQMHSDALSFSAVQVTGDSKTGQVCGTFERPAPDGGVRHARFIFFVDGAGGRNPYISDLSAPYPADKADFAPNWRSQCLALGYRE